MTTFSHYLVMFILLFSSNILAQDIIYLESGDSIIADVKTVGQKIKYKNLSNLNRKRRKTESVLKNDVRSIVYKEGNEYIFYIVRKKRKSTIKRKQRVKTGNLYISNVGGIDLYFEGYNNISEDEFIDKIETNKDSKSLFEESQELKKEVKALNLTGVMVISGLVSTSLLLDISKKRKKNEDITGDIVLFPVFILVVGTTFFMMSSSKTHTRTMLVNEALDLYNGNMNKKKVDLGLRLNPNGVGLTLSF